MAGSVTPVLIRHRSRGVVRTTVTMVTDASGDATATVVGVGFGRLVNVFYNGGLDASALITLKDAASGATLLTYTTGTEGTAVMFRPSLIVVKDDGTTIGAASANYPNTSRDIFLSGKVSITVASGGNAETGTIALVVDESNIGDLAAAASN
jgi:hypothetical protein